ncbi:MAG: hypothetical protein HeimC3_33080 [Candidatus Heimdallarchaeota archaeon LC_3]|nr:MAG: hypothetical protein HeimC3_33080 [Candidatus Heimdallarchaeota archaeon LC_3]
MQDASVLYFSTNMNYQLLRISVKLSTSTIKIKLMGIIRDNWRKKSYNIDISSNEITLKTILKMCQIELGEKFWEFFDKDLSPKRGIIIIVDGVDYNAKGGLDTLLDPKSEITFLSAIHGG